MMYNNQEGMFMAKISGKTQGILYIIVAAFGFAGMSLFVKLAGDLPAFLKAFFRNFVALIYISIILLKEKAGFIPKKESIKPLFCRCFFGTLGLLCNFYAIGKLNLPDANMLNKLSPFFSIIFSTIILREKPNFVQILGVTVAFSGSLLIIKPGFDSPAVIPALAGALGGMGAGIAYTFVRKLGSVGENSRKIVFWFSTFSCLLCLPFLIFTYKPMTAMQTLYLILAGTFACMGQIGITKAYIYAPAKEISVYDYTQVLFSAVLGYLIFKEIPDVYSFIGYALICGSGIAMFFYTKHKSKAL